MRQLVGELMDDPSLDEREHRHALRGLARLNRASFASGTVYNELARLAAGGPLHAVDIATGSADVPIGVLRRAGHTGRDFRYTVCDSSEVALRQARLNAERAGVALETQRVDLLRDPIPEGDVVTCSLFFHHLESEACVDLLRRIAAGAHRALVVSDLRRGAWGRSLALAAPRMLTTSRVVHVDAARSERAAFTIGEMRQVFADAGMGDAVVRPAFPARLLATWERGS